MDQSEENVNMCRAAKEIQDKWDPSVGDFIYSDGATTHATRGDPQYGHDILIHDSESGYMGIDENDVNNDKDHYVWLPKQDQLQDMCADLNEFKPIYSLSYVTMWAEAQGFDCGANDYAESLNSLEQVWLAYVMDENYHKKWNGSEWVKA